MFLIFVAGANDENILTPKISRSTVICMYYLVQGDTFRSLDYGRAKAAKYNKFSQAYCVITGRGRNLEEGTDTRF